MQIQHIYGNYSSLPPKSLRTLLLSKKLVPTLGHLRIKGENETMLNLTDLRQGVTNTAEAYHAYFGIHTKCGVQQNLVRIPIETTLLEASLK